MRLQSLLCGLILDPKPCQRFGEGRTDSDLRSTVAVCFVQTTNWNRIIVSTASNQTIPISIRINWMTGFKSGACNMVPGSWAGPFHNRVHGFPYLDFDESGCRFYCIANADSSLSSPYACSSSQWFNSSLTAFSFYFQEIKWCFTCRVILCVVFQCVF